jgi:CheY-like chemotaxis protein
MSTQDPSRSILIVEDDTEVRETLAEILVDEGYRVALAANGNEALRHLRGAPAPRVILLDLMMPVMDGWEFRRQQQQDAGLASVPVVIVSGDSSVAQNATSLRADGYLVKPINLDTLLETIKLHCG